MLQESSDYSQQDRGASLSHTTSCAYNIISNFPRFLLIPLTGSPAASCISQAKTEAVA